MAKAIAKTTSKTSTVVVTNCSKQMIPLNLQPPGGDFFVHSQNVYLQPGMTTTLPSSYLNEAQIENLQHSRKITLRSG